MVLGALSSLVSGGLTEHGFLRDLALVLCVAAVTTVLFQRLRQPVVLGYLLAGLIVGPQLYFQLVGDPGTIQTLSSLGVVLLMFSLGLEFTLGRIVALGPSAAFVTLIEVGLMLWLGFSVGRLFGWSWRECLFSGGVVAVSSTMLIRKVFAEVSIERRIRDTVTGILVFEDLVAVVLLASLTALAAGEELSAQVVGDALLRLGVFLGVALGVGLLIVPRAMRAILALRRKETVLVACVGLSFALALFAERSGCSLALGAFLAGTLVAESGEGEWIEELVRPVRDVFAAIFFVSVGMSIDPSLMLRHWPAVVALTLVVLVGKVAGVSFGSFLTGKDTQSALRSGICMAQIGELSFVIAALGVSSRATGEFLYPVAVGVSSLSAFASPFLIRDSQPIAAWIEAHLPRKVSTYATLYGSWLAEIRERSSRDLRWRSVRRAGIVLALDALVLTALIIAGSLGATRFSARVHESLGIDGRWATALTIGVFAALCTYPWLGIARGARRLARVLSEMALPRPAEGRMDAGAAPRRALDVGLQFGLIVCVGVPMAVATEPFLPRFVSPLVLLVLVAPVAWLLWRSATGLEGHLRAGAEVIVEALVRRPKDEHSRALDDVNRLLPGLGEVTMVRIEPRASVAGSSLRELAVEVVAGARVVAIVRGERRLVLPGGDERLHSGDLLALTGTHAAVTRAVAGLSELDTAASMPNQPGARAPAAE